MIKYDSGDWGIVFIFRLTGSVFPKAWCWAMPNALLAIFLHWFIEPSKLDGERWANSMQGVDIIWGGYTFVLGFLVVFRNNQAYTRFWEGATLINQVRGEWFNAVSSLIAFCNKSEDKKSQVDHFQHLLVRLASMLYCSALQQVCALEDDTLEIIDTNGMDETSLDFLTDANDRCEIIIQWIQRLIVDAECDQVLKVAPPILSRAFQELSRGIVNLNNARKIKEISFPFPYAQMITCMLLVHWMVTPLLASQVIHSWYWAGIVCFFVTIAFWCLIYIALEIDQPFGEDANDLPIREMQRDFNRSLLILLEPLAQSPPSYFVPPSNEFLRPSLSKSDSAIRSHTNLTQDIEGDNGPQMTQTPSLRQSRLMSVKMSESFSVFSRPSRGSNSLEGVPHSPSDQLPLEPRAQTVRSGSPTESRANLDNGRGPSGRESPRGDDRDRSSQITNEDREKNGQQGPGLQLPPHPSKGSSPRSSRHKQTEEHGGFHVERVISLVVPE